MPLLKPEETYSEDLYRFVWPDGIEMILERFTEAKDDIACELTVNSAHPTLGGNLVDGKKLLLLGPNSLRDMAKALGERDPTPDWGGMLGQATTLSRRRYRRGEPPTDLRTELEIESRYLVRPLLIEGGTTVWFGNEESAKSMLAMSVAIAVASGEEVAGLVAEVHGPVLYLDWEDEANTHKERLRALCHGVGVDLDRTEIWHQRMSASLHESSRDLRRLIAERGAVFAIIDSIGMASGGDPAEAAGIIKAMIAARSLGIPVLGIHHLPKEAKDKSRPYGSVYAAAEARMTWLVEKDETAPTGTTRIALTNKKSNRSSRHPRLAFDFTFHSDPDRELLESVTVEPMGFMESVAIGTGAGQKWRIHDILGTPLFLPEIAAAVSITRASAKMQLNRHKDLFAKLPDGRWARSVSAGVSPPESPRITDTTRIESLGAPLGALIRGEEERTEEEPTDDGWVGGFDGMKL